MHELLQITLQYSNAVLVAVLPHITDFAKKLDLPIPTPVTASQVARFQCSTMKDNPGGWVALTNHFEFAFSSGRISLYRSPRSYYSLQNPDRVPEFFGPVKITRQQALGIARGTLQKLGYTNAAAPQITDPPKVGTHQVPRYRFKWSDPDGPSFDGKNIAPTVDIEVDASTRQVQMLYLLSHSAPQTPLKVAVQPPLAKPAPKAQPAGQGRDYIPVSKAYSNEFLVAILPQINDYITKAGFSVHLPVTLNDVDLSRYQCGLVDGSPLVFLHLKTGERFVYSHGQVVDFYAADTSSMPGEADRPIEKFFGPIKMSKADAVNLVRQTIQRLGYSEQSLPMNKPPQFSSPYRRGTNTFSRYFIHWYEQDINSAWMLVEVDATAGKVKSICINDNLKTNIWRDPPKINIPPN